MSTFIKPGDQPTFTAPSGGVTVGVPLLIGSLLVIPKVTAAEGVQFAAHATGVHLLGKTTGTAWTEGMKLYWKVSTAKFITVATDGSLQGVAARAAASGDTTGYVRLQGVAADTAEGPQGAIVDLTDSTGLSGTHDDTLAATTVPADLTGGESPTEAEHNAALAVMRVMAQNDSDIAQKVIEIRTALINAGIIAA